MRLLFTLLLLFIAAILHAQYSYTGHITTRQDTLKGSITPERTWWDLLRYDLTIEPDYARHTLSGSNKITYKPVGRGRIMQIDLQPPLKIDSVVQKGLKLKYTQDGAAWYIHTIGEKGKLRSTSLTVYYSGQPKESVSPPWDGGLIWAKDSLGRPWITVACQLSGASVWYPCKVHQYDEPDDGASITIVCADSLKAIGNGRLVKSINIGNNKTAATWWVTNPINNYGLSFYIGKYVSASEKYDGERGKLDLSYHTLDYNREKIAAYLQPEVRQMMQAMEYWLGPYPFYEDGYQIIEAPHIGMEHQSATAYGNQFRYGRHGLKRLTYWDGKTDRLLVHESAHEWWGNNITTKDYTDRWIHEGFTAYAEELFIEYKYGKEAARQFYYDRSKDKLGNTEPVIKRYGIFEDGGEDMYMKGWIVVHMLRAIMNDDTKFRAMLRDMNKVYHLKTVTSAEIESYISRYMGRDMSKFFDQYLRNPYMPVLNYKVGNASVQYRFSNCIPGFTMPVYTNLSAPDPLYPSTDWQQLTLDAAHQDGEIRIDPDFYIEAYDPDGFARKSLIWDGDTLRYRAMYPVGYDASKKYPVVIFLHGSGARGSDNEAQLTNVPQVFTSAATRQQYPFILIVPQCGRDDAWVNFPDFPASLRAADTMGKASRLLIRLAERMKYRTDTDSSRIYLTGYSMGGEGTLHLIGRRPALFAAAAAFCPVGDTATAPVIAHIPLWIFHGEKDAVNDVQYSRIMVDALKNAGSTVRYTEYPGMGHKVWSRAYEEPKFLNWLFAQKKK